jgi:AcrR family transcriptional regulator
MSHIELNDKKIQILEVAEKLFSEKGFEGTSIRDISKHAKINIAMVSYYFGSKERLLEALILYKTSDLKLQLENLLQENLEPIEKVNKLIEIYINRISCNKGIFRVLHFELNYYHTGPGTRRFQKRYYNSASYTDHNRNLFSFPHE